MSEGTHKPTPKRLKEARKQGDIAHSRDLIGVAALAGGAIGLAAGVRSSSSALTELARACAATADGVRAVEASDVAHAFIITVAPSLIGACAGALIAGLGQLGWPPALKAPGFDLTRVLNFGGLKEAWSPKSAARRAFSAAAKVLAVGLAVLVAIRGELSRGLSAETPSQIASRIGGALLRMSMSAGAALIALAAVDYLLARRRINKKLMMTTDQVRREMREQEGDPHIKGKRRRKMRELGRRRMAQEVKSADVVVVNPTHYAVALRYHQDKDGAPKVVAKGMDEVAAKIREIARQSGVPILSRPPLARALHKVPEGREVPAPLYKAVAEVLAYVYRLRRSQGRKS